MYITQILKRLSGPIKDIIIPANFRTEQTPNKQAINDHGQTFDLINVSTDYPILRKSIWPSLGKRVQGTTKIQRRK